MKRRSLLAALLPPAAALLLAGCAGAPAPRIPAAEAAGTRFEIVILHANDVYEISPLDNGRVGGLARVATVLRDLERRAPHTLAVLAGDFVSPSLIGGLSRTVDGEKTPVAGEQMVAVLNAVGFDYVVFGNHEFDVSEQSLAARIAESDFSYVAANVRHAAGGAVAAFEQRGAPIPDYVVHTFTNPDGGELRLGLIGLTLPFNQASYVAYEDTLAAGRRAYEAAAAESDLVFALTHQSLDEDRDLARSLPGLPLILGGHDHINLKVTEGTTRIAKADANARTVYLHWLTHDTADGSTEVWSQLVPITNDIADDPETQALVDAWERTAEELIRELGYEANSPVADFLEPYDGREAEVRTGQTNLGQSIACAMRAADTAGSELAFLNSGSIRIDDRIVGRVQQRDVLRTLPFGGEIVHARMRGAILEMALDAGLGANLGEGGYLQLTPNVVPTEAGYAIDGAPLDREREYRVTMPGFLSQGLEANLEFLADEATYEPLDDLRGVDGSLRNDLRDVWILYLASGAECGG
ncbi:MAG: bifunctional metallophosphatase/5'-nucleotidase [Acidobacteriota bacterium]|nr:bifunctional metallophosphatase/5'-nucleotidase [Acidobacteriota bacterium]